MAKPKLTWNVYVEEINRKEIRLYNIFEYGDLEKQFKKLKKKYIDDKDTFLKEVDRRLSYLFWAKCEWEVTIWDWPSHQDFNYKKISVYDQIKNNWSAFSEYLWNNL